MEDSIDHSQYMSIQHVIFQPGDVLFEEGDTTYHFYIIQAGEVEIFKRGDDGNKVKLAVAGEGVSIGEFAMIDRRPRSATAQALTVVEAARVSEQAFQHLLTELPDWAVSMMKALVGRIRANNEIVRRSTSAASETVRKELDGVEYDTGVGGTTYLGQTPNLGSDE